ncbi:universal stress protein [Reichenbachiella versicolor]|uniref:universal stress protein n=1 Tax=Reichenbachiella versicolor TaxID=1821036 RepID=UPI000D6E57DB|nr:universal stress protein [Reichenbachiella versicolor]
MNNILVPFDFSEHAIAGLDYAIEINKINEGRIHLLHVIEFPVTNTFNVEGEMGNLDLEEKAYVLALIKKTSRDLEEIMSSPKYKDENIVSKLVVGRPYQGITEAVDEMGIDLIIMGTKGATGLEEMLVGSNAEKIVRKVKCPVVTLHSDIVFKPIKNLLVAIDISSDNDQLLAAAKKIQEVQGAVIHMLWVNTPKEEYHHDDINDRMNKIAKKAGIENYESHIAPGLKPEEGIITFGKELGAELIAISTHSRKGLAHFLLGSIAEDTINHSPIPVLTITLN